MLKQVSKEKSIKKILQSLGHIHWPFDSTVSVSGSTITLQFHYTNLSDSSLLRDRKTPEQTLKPAVVLWDT